VRVLATAGRRLGRPSDAECAYLGLIRAARAANNIVEMGTVTPLSDLTRYDVVLCEVPDPGKVERDAFRGAMWALSQPHAVAVIDHWNVYGLWDRLARELSRSEGWVAETVLALLRGKVRTAVCAFPWGDRNGLIPNAWFFDPSWMMTQPMLYNSKEKERRAFVLATYESHREWLAKQRLPWPLEERGRKAHGRQSASLPEVIQLYKTCWGAVVPPYERHVGSGYWRCRYVHMAQCRSLFWLDPRDAAPMDPTFRTDKADLANMNDEELEELAETQSRWFFSSVWSAQRFIEETNLFLGKVRG